MRFFSLALALFAPLLALASPIDTSIAERSGATGLPRLVIYFQTTHDQSGNPISMLPLVNDKGIALTHLIVCSLHVQNDGTVHLNDKLYNDPIFDTLWQEAAVLKQNNIKVMGMVGGAAAGSFAGDTLGSSNTAQFEAAYASLAAVIRNQGLQGLDIDVEQSFSQANIERLINRLAADFGPDFIITLAPVASALEAFGGNLSGFNYKTLDNDVGSKIGFYNAQYYSGFGSMSSTYDFDAAVSNGFHADRIVIGQLTSPSNGYGYTDPGTLNRTVIQLRNKYGTIGGVMGWEYFNSQPGGTAAPWQWAEEMTQILRPNAITTLSISQADAVKLNNAWTSSTKGKSKPKVNYNKWINV